MGIIISGEPGIDLQNTSIQNASQVELTTKRAEARELLNTLEAGLLMLQVGAA